MLCHVVPRCVTLCQDVVKAALKLRDFYTSFMPNFYSVGSAYFGINLDSDDEIEKIICAIIGNNHKKEIMMFLATVCNSNLMRFTCFKWNKYKMTHKTSNYILLFLLSLQKENQRQ